MCYANEDWQCIILNQVLFHTERRLISSLLYLLPLKGSVDLPMAIKVRWEPGPGVFVLSNLLLLSFNHDLWLVKYFNCFDCFSWPILDLYWWISFREWSISGDLSLKIS